MYLKSITLRGFKSFASTTVFEFSPGINAVVGPNGSGKSNLVDALSWVMGMQGVKSLRGAAMNDLIFAGATSRSALGRTKVTLVLDNSDGALSLPDPEIQISRTMFRSGGSEYELNGATARLTDIQDLLADAGLGQSQHTVVGQGQIDRVLHATAAERRLFIEEAAGILKYRRRIDKAEHKLQSLKNNLERLEDLETELGTQLQPLGAQAETARTARELQARARSLRTELYAYDTYLLSREEVRLEELVTDLHRRKEEIQKQFDDSQRRGQQLQAQGLELERHISTRQEQRTNLEKVLARLEATLAVAGERKQTDTEQVESHRADLAPAQATLKQEKQVAQCAQDQQVRLSKQLQDARTSQTEASSRLQKLEEEYATYTQQHSEHRQQVTTFTSALAAARAGYDRACENTNQRAEEVKEARAAAEKTGVSSTDAELSLAAQQSKTNELETAHKLACASSKKCVHEFNKCQKKLTETRVRLASLLARKQTLQESLDVSEHSVAASSDPQGLAQVHEILVIRPGWERAISTALENFAEAWVTESAESETAEFSRIFPVTQEISEAAIDLPAGFFLAGEMIEAEPDLKQVLDPVLADTVLAPAETRRADLEDLFRAYPRLRVISAEGTVFTGYATLLPPEAARRVIEISALLQQVEHEIESLTRQKNRKQSALDTALKSMESAQEHEKVTAQSLGRARAKLANARTEYNRLQLRQELAAAELNRLVSRHATAQKKSEEAVQKLEDAINSLDRLTEKPVHDDGKLAEQLESQRLLVHREEQNCAALEVKLENAQQKQVESAARVKRAQEVLNRIEETVATEQALKESRTRRKIRALSVEKRALILRKRLIAEIEHCASATHQLQAQKQELVEQGSAHRDIQKSVGEKIEQVNLTLGESSVKRARLEAQRENLEKRAADELGEDLSQLLETFIRRHSRSHDPHLSDFSFDRQSRETELIEVEKQLADLGEVNPLALEEFSALEARYSYLSEQIQDLKKSRADMRSLIRDLNKHIRQEFNVAFAETRTHFERIFSNLFPQGEGTLVLTDANNPLDTGIDIQARPAGKKIRRLSLLSGGERALASLAFLTAIFAARPSPFYVLDEAEAALDDRNLMRVLNIFKDLGEKSQLVMITHKPRTVEIADSLLGIGMRDGVSTVISQNADTLRQLL